MDHFLTYEVDHNNKMTYSSEEEDYSEDEEFSVLDYKRYKKCIVESDESGKDNSDGSDSEKEQTQREFQTIMDKIFLKQSDKLVELVDALENNDEPTVLKLLKDVAVNSKIKQYWNQDWILAYPLHVATAHQHRSLVQVLLDHGAFVDCQDRSSSSPLHLAVKSSNVDLASLLLRHGASANLKDDRSLTPFHYALGSQDMMALMFQQDLDSASKNDLLLHATLTENLPAVRLLLDRDADVAAKNDLGQTGLCLAAKAGNEDLVKLLIEHGSDLSASDESQDTPLHQALRHFRPKVLQMLLNHGRDLMVQDVYNVAVTSEFMFKVEERTGSLEEVQRVLKEYVVKLSELGLARRDWMYDFHRMSQEDMMKLGVECGREVERMRGKLICGDRNITFFDILTKRMDKLVVYLNVDEVRERLEGMDFEKEFPVYAEMFRCRIGRGVREAMRLKGSYEALGYVLGGIGKMPEECMTKILRFLRVRDVKVLRGIYKSSLEGGREGC